MKKVFSFSIFIFAAVLLCLQSTLAEKYQTRIINGVRAAKGQFPWQVILKRDEWDDLLCGGSIIAANWVLTAGHCTYGLDSIFLMFGSIFLDNENALNMTSSEIFIHPQYNAMNLNYDVSMIYLPQALVFSNIIAPIALVPRSAVNNSFVGKPAVISGFGFVEDVNLDFSPNLLYAYVTVLNNNACAMIYGSEIVLDSTLCTIGASSTNMSICNGDSGGPLVSWDSRGQLMQIGINSYVKEDSCTLKYPAGYARVTYFLDYIHQTMLTNGYT